MSSDSVADLSSDSSAAGTPHPVQMSPRQT